MWGVLLGLMLAGVPDAKAAADQAYRKGKYDVACPLYQQLAERKKHDPWAWNDLALCRLKQRSWTAAEEALNTATSLEAAVHDEKLAGAIAFNLAALQKGVLAAPGQLDDVTVAERLGRRALEAKDNVLARQLLLHARDVLDGGEFKALAALVLSRNDANPQAPLDPKDSALGYRLLEQAEARGEDVGELWTQVSEVELGPVPSVPNPPAWLADCKVLDPERSKGCGRTWLLCTASSSGEYGASTQTGVIIDAASIPLWRAPPTEAASPSALLELHVNEGEGRCDARDSEGNYLGSPPDSSSRWLNILDAEVCFGRLDVVQAAHPMCADNTYRHVRQDIVLATPPPPDAGR